MLYVFLRHINTPYTIINHLKYGVLCVLLSNRFLLSATPRVAASVCEVAGFPLTKQREGDTARSTPCRAFLYALESYGLSMLAEISPEVRASFRGVCLLRCWLRRLPRAVVGTAAAHASARTRRRPACSRSCRACSPVQRRLRPRKPRSSRVTSTGRAPRAPCRVAARGPASASACSWDRAPLQPALASGRATRLAPIHRCRPRVRHAPHLRGRPGWCGDRCADRTRPGHGSDPACDAPPAARAAQRRGAPGHAARGDGVGRCGGAALRVLRCRHHHDVRLRYAGGAATLSAGGLQPISPP